MVAVGFALPVQGFGFSGNPSQQIARVTECRDGAGSCRSGVTGQFTKGVVGVGGCDASESGAADRAIGSFIILYGDRVPA